MGWGTSPRFIKGQYKIAVYNSRDEIVELFTTDVKECLPILESEARAYCTYRERENPGEHYYLVLLEHKHMRGSHDESL